MRILPPSGVFRRHASSLPTAAALDEEALKIGAALAWISHHGNLEDFPGSRSERMALMTTAIRRGLAAWDRGQDRYKLTKIGKMHTACYSPTVEWANPPAQDSRLAKLGARLLDRFESRPNAMIGAFFAIGVAAGAAAAWAPLSGPSDSALPASAQTSEDSSAVAISNGLSGPASPGAAPQEQAAGVPAAAPASPSGGKAVSTGRAAEPVARQQMQLTVPSLRTPTRGEEGARAAALSGSVAPTRAADHFERDPSADEAQRAASTRFLDSQALTEPKSVPQAQPKPVGQHRGRDPKTEHAGAAPAGERAPTWSQQSDDGGRLAPTPHARRGPDVAEDSIEREAPRHHQSHHLPPREPPATQDDPMGLVGWLFQ